MMKSESDEHTAVSSDFDVLNLKLFKIKHISSCVSLLCSHLSSFLNIYLKLRSKKKFSKFNKMKEKFYFYIFDVVI